MNITPDFDTKRQIIENAVDAIVLTGGLAYDERLVALITERVYFIAAVKVVPGENEMIALAAGALRVLHGQEVAKEYR